MTDREEEDLRAQVASIRTRLNAIDGHIGKMTEKLDHLVVSEAERRGREESQHQHDLDRHDDRWQVWARAFIPAATLTAIFNAIIAWFYGGGR